jgi:hypothetical protein
MIGLLRSNYSSSTSRVFSHKVKGLRDDRWAVVSRSPGAVSITLGCGRKVMKASGLPGSEVGTGRMGNYVGPQ